ncbi:MAG: helix-turn-helix transcriptional regulator [Candidatus Gastranaerophilaceae bacterium]|jgi:transcriptional regulator with XRE-family HTH domain|nr:XRE family transcriptional regulator [bacterium]
MDTKHLLGKRLKEIRKKKGLSQEQLAEMVGFESSNSISNVENGYNYPSIQNLEKMLKALNCSFPAIFTFEQHQETEVLIKKINELLINNPEKVSDFYKILKALVE